MNSKILKIAASVFVLAWIALVVAPAFAQGAAEQTAQIKAWLDNPFVLYGLMLVGSAVSTWKQWQVASMDGSSVTLGSQFSPKHWQELATMLFGNTIAFALLIQTDTLNFLSAVSIGWVINDVSDLNPLGGRSTALMKKE